jgi:anthranilate phosphoribosyltransferase
MSQENAVSEVLYRINLQSEIDVPLLREAFLSVLKDQEGDSRDVQLGAILTGLMARGPTLEETCALIEASFTLDNFDYANKVAVELESGTKLVAAVGSGKKGVKTMNISTPALIVSSVAGAYTCKPVSSGTSSMSGSSDFLSELGVNLGLSTLEMVDVLKKTRFAAFRIEDVLPRFNSSYGGKFFAPHVLSFGLPGIVGPIKYDSILYGLSHPDTVLASKVLKKFGVKSGLVVTSTHDNTHYIDEVGIIGQTKISIFTEEMIKGPLYLRPAAELGLPKYKIEDITQGRTLEQNVKYAVDVLVGKGEPAREDIICVNAGNVLYLAGLVEDYREGYHLAKGIIKSKKTIEKIVEIIESTSGNIKKFYHFL